jgi:putative ABC transport system permease protein
MNWLKQLLSRHHRYDELSEQIREHLHEKISDLMDSGMTQEEAERTARREFGNVTLVEERSREVWQWPTVQSILRDLKYAVRQLQRAPGFSAVVVFILALGIGANAAIFTVIESVLLAPLPYANADRLAVLDTRWSDTGHTTPRVTGADAVDVRSETKSLEAVSLLAGGNEGVQLLDHATYTTVTWVDENFARVFHLQPIAGRLFANAESHRAALVSEDFARDNFGGAQAAVGQSLHIESEAIEIVGVLPSNFNYPEKTQVWEAFPLRPDSISRTAFNYRAVALLRTGANFKVAQAELEGLSRRLQTEYPAENRQKMIVAVPFAEALTGNVRPTLMLLWGTVSMILLIACANVTLLQLARSMDRQREIAIRKALGSNPWQVVRPVLMEGLLLACLGGVAGILLAVPTVRVLVAMAPNGLPRATEIQLNGWVLGFTLCISVLTVLGSCLLPALRAAKVNVVDGMKQDAARAMELKSVVRLRNGLVVAEIAATFLLAVGAGLLLRTMATLMKRDMGYETRQMLVVDADAPAHADDDYRRVLSQFNNLFTELERLPGVDHAAGVMGLPTGPYGSNGYYETRGGFPVDPEHKPWAVFSVASPGYFQTMGIPMLLGRGFDIHDTFDHPFVAVISESLAKQSFGDREPIGRQIQCGLDSDKWMTVVGVVGDVRQNSPEDKSGPTLYMPMAQHPYYANQIHVVLRTQVKPLTLVNAVREKILQVNPLMALRFTTMDAMVHESITTERFRAVLISAFAGTGLLLTMLGIYGTIQYSVKKRTFEIALRLAFGAERGLILRGVLGRAVGLACYGIGAGLVLSLILTRLLASMLVGVRPTDPFNLAAAVALILLTSLVAAFAPSWRATRVEPITVLRTK